ncbi:hypothetical protein ACFQ3L_10215 [Lacticaseibacillus jixianensis]|uniref:WxL domain-containing protein n=1 Tax=Lacticaseibacillus jixianensis TaxID=2486012 RepID=A0ABW4BD34_9LACO|nr:hypothetical protein [Lacticaseibacillus jixianensis]
MKKFMTSLVLTAAVAGLFGASNVVRADDTNSLTGSTNASVTFEGGNLSLSNTTGSVAFKGSKVLDVYTSGYADSQPVTATVDDFLSGAKGWTLNVKQTGWTTTDANADAAPLNSDSTALTLGDTAIQATGDTLAGKGDYGHTPDAFDGNNQLSLKIKSGVTVKPGAYSNTLTWTLTDPISATGN